MTEFTPGPWNRRNTVVNDNEFLRVYIEGKNEGKYIQIIPSMDIEDHEDEANINLIAAAPEMYHYLTSLHERLKTILKELQGTEYEYVSDSYTSYVLMQADLALRKAEGKE